MSQSSNKGFNSKLGFIAAASSSAVGVGNIWRFPYLTGKYGGASFVLLYVICVFLLGFPIVLAELAFGRKMQFGTFKAFKGFKPKAWQSLGPLSAITAFFILSFYVIITGWLFGYSFKIFSGNLLPENDFANHFNGFVENVNLNLIFTWITILLIGLIVKKGIKDGIEKISKILMPIFVLMMIGLIIYSVSLKGSLKGLSFYLLPRLDAFSAEAFYAALSQSFLSLSVGCGICITYGAYVEKTENLIKSTAIIVLSDTIISLLAGLIIFPLIFMSEIEPNQGPGLIFISLPIAFKALGLNVGKIFGGTFFLLLVFAAITSAIALLEVVVKYTIEKFNISRRKSINILCIVLFLTSLPSIFSFGYCNSLTKLFCINGKSIKFFDFMDLLWADLMMPLIAVIFSLFIVHKWKLKSLFNEVNLDKSKNKYFIYYLKFTMKYISPFFVSLIIILKLLEFFFGVNISNIF